MSTVEGYCAPAPRARRGPPTRAGVTFCRRASVPSARAVTNHDCSRLALVEVADPWTRARPRGARRGTRAPTAASAPSHDLARARAAPRGRRAVEASRRARAARRVAPGAHLLGDLRRGGAHHVGGERPLALERDFGQTLARGECDGFHGRPPGRSSGDSAEGHPGLASHRDSRRRRCGARRAPTERARSKTRASQRRRRRGPRRSGPVHARTSSTTTRSFSAQRGARRRDVDDAVRHAHERGRARCRRAGTTHVGLARPCARS